MIRLAAHGPELEHVELAPVKAHSPLTEENGATNGDRRARRGKDQQRRYEQNREGGQYAIEGVLDRNPPAARARGVDADQRQRPDPLEEQAIGQPLEQPGHDRDGDPKMLEASQNGEIDIV